MGFYNFETFNRESSVSQGFNNDRFPLYIHEFHPVTFELCKNSNNNLVQNLESLNEKVLGAKLSLNGGGLFCKGLLHADK